MKKIIYAMTFAGICAVGVNAALTAVNGCYQIGTYDELKEFATKVNDGEHSACGKLTANITGNSSLHVSEGGNLRGKDCAIISCKELSFVAWTPIEGFAGTFDGNGKTISGLHMSVSSGAGLFKSVYGGAVIKNLNVADSYFRVSSSQAAGLVSKVESNSYYNEKMVVIDQCTFGGTVAGGNKTTGGTNIGGLVGVVSSGTKLLISNSVNNGRVLSSYTDYNTLSNREEVQENNVVGTNIGGLIAYVEFGATASIANCYNTGKVDDKNGTSISATVATASGTVEKDNVACLTGVANCANAEAMSSANLTSSFNNYDQSNIFAFYDAATVESIIGAESHPGVTFSDEGNVLVATFTDDATTFSIPQDIKVDKVVFNRKFTNTKSSTIALPFSAITSVIAGAKFYTITGVTPRDQSDENSRDTVVGDGVSSVEAYVPYLVQPTGNDGSFAVSGAVTLKKTPASQNTTVGDWSFITALEKKVWRRADEEKGLAALNEGEIGRIYGFAGAKSDGFDPGNFVRVEKANIMPMRAYLKYTGNLGECGNALCKASPVVLSDSMVVRLNSIKTVDPSVGGEVTDPEEETTSIVKPFVAPVAEKANRWYDLSGRRLNKKPSNRGSFYSKQAIVK